MNDEIAAQGLKGNVSKPSKSSRPITASNWPRVLQIKPYATYIFHPDQYLFDVSPNPKVTYAFETGLRLTVALNDVLGLPKYFRPN